MSTIPCIAITRGFLKGRMVEAGAQVGFDTTPAIAGGPPRPLPKWLVPKAEYKPPPAVSHDTKPPDAQRAVAQKASQIRGAR